MTFFEGVPGKIYVAIFTIVVSLFTFSTKKNYDYWNDTISEFKEFNVANKLNKSYFQKIQSKENGQAQYFKALKDIYDVTVQKDYINPKDTIKVIAKNAIKNINAVIIIGETHLAEHSGTGMEAVEMLHNFYTNTKKCWETLYEYCTMNESGIATRVQLENQLEEFNSAYENIEFYLKNDYDKNMLGYDVDMRNFWWEWVGFIFWTAINLATLVLIIMMAYFGVAFYLLGKNKK